MQLKSLVSVEIDTGRSQQGATQIIDGLNKINKSAYSAKESVTASNTATKKYFNDYAKTSKEIASTATSTGNKLSGAYDKSTNSVRTFEGAARKAQAANDSFFNAGRSNVLAFTAAIAGAAYTIQSSLSGIIKYSDAWANVNNSLVQVSESESDLLQIRAKVLEVSKDTFSSLSGTADLYSGLARSTKTLGLSQERLIGVTETINNLFLSGGKAASETAGAITQLNQGLAAGALRGDEFNSVAEGAPKIMDALAESLHMGRGELREFAATGGITSEILVTALESYSDEAERMVDITQRTFGQNSELAKTYLIEYVGNMEAFQKITASAGNALVFFASNLDTVSQIVQSLAVGGLVAATLAMGKYAFSLATVAKESLFMVTTTKNVGGSLVTLTTRATLAQVGMNALALGARGATAAMALLGGPIGVITLAASALIYFSMQASAAEKDLEKLKTAGEGAAEEFKKFGEAQKTQALTTLREELKLATNQVEMYQKRLEYNAKTGSNPWYSEEAKKSFLDLQANLERSTQNADKLQKEFDTLNKIKFDEVEKEIVWIRDHLKEMVDLSNLGLAKVGSGVLKQFSMIKSGLQGQKTDLVKVSEEYKKQQQMIEKQIALFGNKSKAVELAYDLENGLIKGIKKGEGELLVARLKTLEAMEKQAEAAEKLAEVNKKAAEKAIADEKKKQKELMNEQKRFDKSLIESRLERDKELVKIAQENSEKAMQPWIAATERLDEDFANAWSGAFDSFESFKDKFVNSLKQMVGEVVHQLTTKKFTDAITNFLMLQSGGQGAGMGAISQNLGSSTQGYTGAAYSQWAGAQGGSSAAGNASQAGSLISTGGVYGAIAVAVIAGVSVWNDAQDEKFEKLTAEYRQGTQSTGTLLGMANKKSESLNRSTEDLLSFANDSLSVNYSMLQELIGIRVGLSATATGVAKALSSSGLNPETGTVNTWSQSTGGGNASASLRFAKLLEKDPIFGEVGGFLASFGQGVYDKISSAISSKKTKIIDQGIGFLGESLASILESGTVGAFSYADVKTTKKFLGIKTSVKVKTETEDLDELLSNQLADVFKNGADVLREASGVFGVDFDKYLDKLKIDPQKLSLKGLEGDALEKELGNFLSSNLDKFATILLTGTDVLKNFQQNGEGAFETYVRLASETRAFTQIIDQLGLKFSAVGVGAITASQNMIEMSGGIESLQTKLNNYYDKFFSQEDKLKNITNGLTEQFEEMGIALPSSREALKEYVSGLDLANEADAKRANQIFDLANYLDIYYKEIERIESDAYDTRLQMSNDFANEFKSKIDLFNDSIKKAADVARDAHAALIASIGAVRDNIEFSIVSIKNVAPQSIEQLRENVGKGSLQDQVKNAQSLVDAINNKYNTEIEKINESREIARSAFEKQNDLERQAAENNLSYARQMLEFSKQLVKTADDLLLSDLSPLLNKQKLDIAKAAFENADAEDAAQAAQNYLKESRAFYASGEQYTSIFQSVQDQLRSMGAGGEGAFANAQASYNSQLGAINSRVFNESEFDKQVEIAKLQSIALLEELEPVLSEIQDRADAELEKTMFELAEKTTIENQKLVDELKLQTVQLNLIPEKLTEVNTALIQQLEAARALIEETRVQTAANRIQSDEAIAQTEVLRRRIEELQLALEKTKSSQ